MTPPATSRPRLLLLDGHSLAYRAFYALPVENFSTADGRHTNAVYGFVSMLINTLRDEAPTHLAVAFDLSRVTFRTAEFPDYKANRSASPSEFKPQVDTLREVLAALKIPALSVANFEADDVIATLARAAEREGFDVLILTGDRDALQLVTDNVTVLYPKKGVSDLSRMTPVAVEEKYGIRADQYADFAAVRGDPSDNLPGIPGVGEKTATKWIQTYGSVDGLAEHVDEVKGKVGDALRENLASVLLNRRLTQLVDDVPLDITPKELERQSWDRHEVDTLFDELEFRVLRERLHATLPDAESSDASSAADAISGDGESLQPGEVAAWLTDHAGSGRMGVSIDGVWGRGTGRIDALALAAADDACAWLDLDSLTSADSVALAAWWSDDQTLKCVHDANGASLAAAAMGWEVAGITSDTELAAYLAQPDQRAYEIPVLVRRYLGVSLNDDDPAEAQLSLDTDIDDTRSHQSRAKARAVRDLAIKLDEHLASIGALALLTDLELPLTRTIVEVERCGIAVDVDRLKELAERFADRAREAQREAESIAGHPVNLASPKQLQVVLFDELGMPKTKKTKTGFTTDAESLQNLYVQTEHPFLEQLLEHRDAARLRSTVEGLLASVSTDGRIHTTYNQTIAATGRLSSTDPNLQNIPVRTEAGRGIRDCFIVGEGYETLLTADYSQIEMRIMAHLSDDEGLIEAFRSGEDLHTTVGSRVFGVSREDVDAEMRRRIKAMSYGLAYGLSPYGLSRQLDITPGEAQTLMDEYFLRFGGVRDYLTGVVADARVTGYTETILGRRRYLPDLTSDQRQRRETAERMALNAPIQGSAADIIKVAMLNVAGALKSESLKSRLMLQVHDELVIEVAPGESAAVETLVRREMAAAYPLNVPLDVSVGTGTTWSAAAH